MKVVLDALDAAEQEPPQSERSVEVAEQLGVPLWRPRNATGLFDGLPTIVRHESS